MESVIEESLVIEEEEPSQEEEEQPGLAREDAWFKLTKSQTLPLTPALVDEFYCLPPSPTERAIKPSRVKMLEEKLAEGLLISFNWGRSHLPTGEVWRQNGQHSVAMLHALNGNIPAGLFVHMDDFDVSGKAGAVLLFRQYDDRRSGRSPTDVSGAYQGVVDELADVSRETGKLGIEGIAWYQRNVEGIPVPKGDDAYKLFHRRVFWGFLIWLNTLLNGERTELRNTTVVAAMYAAWLKSESAAQDFWKQVKAGGLEFEEKAPSTVLAQWLETTADMSALDKKTKKVGPNTYYGGSIHAWNAFRLQKTITNIPFNQRDPFSVVVND